MSGKRAMRRWCLAPLGLLVLILDGLVLEAAAQEAALEPALAVAADYSPVYPTRRFTAPVTELSIAFRLGADESYDRLTATFIAVDVGGAAPPGYEIVETSVDPNQSPNAKAGRFRYTQPQPMPLGKYRVDVTADGEPWRSAAFEIVPAVEAAAPAEAEAIVPLTPGRTWTYAFTQRPGEGVQIALPGVAPEPDGSLRAVVTVSVAGAKDGLVQVERRLNGAPIYTEWWRLDSAGLHAVHREQNGEVVPLDPPQLFLALPLEAGRSWDYQAADGSYGQTYRIWGPVPVEGPHSAAPGWVVLTTRRSSEPLSYTVERHFLPGVGMVREIFIQALNGQLLSREEMVLTGYE